MTDEAFDRWWAKFEGKTWTTERGARTVWNAAVQAERETQLKAVERCIAALEERLELHACNDAGDPVKLEIGRADGIGFRDAIIKAHDEKAARRETQLKAAEERIAELEERLESLTESNP